MKELLKIEKIDLTGYEGDFIMRGPLSAASLNKKPEMVDLLLNHGAGINAMFTVMPTCDMTNKIVFGYLKLFDGNYKRITRDMAGFEKTITNTHELANAILQGHLSEETIQILKENLSKPSSKVPAIPKSVLFIKIKSFLYRKWR